MGAVDVGTDGVGVPLGLPDAGGGLPEPSSTTVCAGVVVRSPPDPVDRGPGPSGRADGAPLVAAFISGSFSPAMVTTEDLRQGTPASAKPSGPVRVCSV
nr:hypothetical protein [Micromonospora provocatoris]